MCSSGVELYMRWGSIIGFGECMGCPRNMAESVHLLSNRRPHT